jgi:hypothetical protein
MELSYRRGSHLGVVDESLRYAADSAFAMLAGMQLDVFTPLKDGAKTPENIAKALGTNSPRLPLLLYSLAAAGLLHEEHGHFSNTPNRINSS